MSIHDFINECTNNGINSPEAICEEALAKIKEIDHQLYEADLLRKKKVVLNSVIKSFGYTAPKRKYTKVSEEMPQEKLDDISLGHAIRICIFLETNTEASPRELMTECGVTVDSDFELYAVIKWLCAQGICSRKPENRSLIQGPKWDSRPQQKEII